MVIIITGPTHVGKTMLAQKLLEKLHYPYLSIDHLKMGLIRSGNTNLTPLDDEELTNYLWPIVREMIKTAIENKQNLIVEGCYIPFNYRDSFDGDYLQHIKFICLAMSSDYIKNHYDDIIKYASSIEQRLYEDTTIEELINDNQKIVDGFIAYHEKVYLIEKDFLLVEQKIIDHLVK